MAKSKRQKSDDPARGSGSTRTRAAQGPFKRKSCFLCKNHIQEVDYKNIDELRRYTSERGKIRARRMTGACRKHQRQVAVAIKRAREMALLPYIAPSDAPPARSRSSRKP